MPSTLHFTIPHPLPSHLGPEIVLSALQTYEPLVTSNPYLVSFRRRPVDLAEIIDDPFFRDDGVQLAAFEVVDKIVLVPGLASKEITIPCVMQSFEGGVRCRSYAQGGVKVWSTWTIRLRTAAAGRKGSLGGSAGSLSGSGSDREDILAAASPGVGEWELVEEARVECSSFVKPFVGKSFVSAHKEILKKIVDGIIRASSRGQFAHRFA